VKKSRMGKTQNYMRADKAVIVVMLVTVMSFGATYSPPAKALDWTQVLNQIIEVGSTIVSEFASNFTSLFNQLDKDTDRLIRSQALANDAVINNQVSMFNANMLNNAPPPPQRCVTENIGASLTAVDSNSIKLAAKLNDKMLANNVEGEKKPVSLAKADVKNHEETFKGPNGESMDGPSMLLSNPKQPFGNSSAAGDALNKRAAVQSFVNRIVNPVPLPPVPESQKETNKGILYRKAQLDYLAPLQLSLNSFSYAMALNDEQTGLATTLRKDIEEEDEYALKLLKDDQGNDLKAASKNTLMYFESRRRLSPFWQKQLGEKMHDSVTREVVNILAMQNYMTYENYKSRQRTELLLSAMLANKLKNSSERQRLLELFRELN